MRGERQSLYADDVLYVDLKTYHDQQIVFAMNTSDQAMTVQLNTSLFETAPSLAWDLMANSPVSISGGRLNFVIPPLSGSYILLGLPVPEPSAAVLLCVAAAAMQLRRRRIRAS